MFARALVAFLFLAPAVPALAQGQQTVPPFVVQSDKGDNRLQLTGLLQFDGRFAEEGVSDTFLIRRARVSLQGRVARVFEFYLNPDFAGGTLTLFDAYLDTRFADAFRVRIGKAKTPFGLERLQSASWTLFVERALPTALVPNRDVGVQVLGDLPGGIVSYGASLSNGTTDGGSTDLDANEGKDAAGRVLVRPFARAAQNPLAGLAIGIAGSTGDQPPALPALRTTAQQTFFSYAAGATGTGRRTRISPQGAYYAGPFGGIAEYVRSTGNVERAGVTREIAHEAWQVSASWVLTGEAASDRGIRPRRNFDPQRGGIGAIQVAARVHALTVDGDVVALGLAVPGASREVEAAGLAINWYLNPLVRWTLHFERSVFDGDADGPRPAENAILLRGQLTF